MLIMDFPKDKQNMGHMADKLKTKRKMSFVDSMSNNCFSFRWNRKNQVGRWTVWYWLLLLFLQAEFSTNEVPYTHLDGTLEKEKRDVCIRMKILEQQNMVNNCYKSQRLVFCLDHFGFSFFYFPPFLGREPCSYL